MRQIGIIGGGASGMMAAVAAARMGAYVTILEKQDRIGKKILATGNGKCNLSNLSFSAERDYNSSNPEKLNDYFLQFSVQDTVQFFKDCGLIFTEKNGYLYPRSGQASTILNLFLELLEKYRVNIVTDCQTSEIRKNKKGSFEVETNQGRFMFDALIISAGSNAGTKEKDKLGGLELTDRLGIKSTRMLPALTALQCQGDFWKALAGVRCDGEVSLHIHKKNGKTAQYTERGEIQLTDYGISGIPVFQLSRHASNSINRNEKVNVVIDFFPDIAQNEWKHYCIERAKQNTGRCVLAFLEGMVHKKIAQVLMKEAGMKVTDTVSFPMTEPFWKMMRMMRCFQTVVIKTNPAANAQVCMGGVVLSELDKNLQVKKYPGLYVTGELLDVDGRCGGYNLQWAWSSGWIAGCAAMKGNSV